MRRLAIMQPYFFPYLGYFSLIRNADEFILLDAVQYIRHGWINRNRILKQSGGWLYIQVPTLLKSHKSAISEARIDNSQPWRRRILDQLAGYKRLAPNYWVVRKLVEDSLDIDTDSLVELNLHSLRATCAYLGIATPISTFSRTELEIQPPAAADEWALNICRALGDVDEYWNPPGGRDLFDPRKYEAAGIRLRFQELHLREYDQGDRPFEPALSIIDVLMFNPVEEVQSMLADFSLDSRLSEH